ncbi:MAG: hypothetical protein R3B09_14815 [Nannocystaceae bacterium]
MRFRALNYTLVTLVALFALGGCTDPVDAFLDSYDTRIHETCECVPILALTDSPAECYKKLGVTPTERECVHTAVGKDKAALDALECRSDAEEAFVNCISGLQSCDLDGYGDCNDAYDIRTGGCPDVPDSIENNINKCLD